MDRKEAQTSFHKRKMASFKLSQSTKDALSTMGLSAKEVSSVEIVCESRDSIKQGVLKEELWGILAKVVSSFEDNNKSNEELDTTVAGGSQKEPPSPAASFKSANGAEASKGEEEKPKDLAICWHYKNGICKFGQRGKNKEGKCPFSHPRKCEKFTFGGPTTLGCRFKGCKKVHPYICKTWKRGQNCTDADCKRLHLQVPSDRVDQPALQRMQRQPENSRPEPWRAQSQSSQQHFIAPQQQLPSTSQQQPLNNSQQQHAPASIHTQEAGVTQAFLERRLHEIQTALLQQITTSIRAALQQQPPPSPRVPQPQGRVGPPPGFNTGMWPSLSQASQHQ